MSDSLFDDFEMNDDFELNGINIDYGHTRILLARAGGSNEAFTKALSDMNRKYGKRIENGSLANGQADQLLAKIMSRHLIRKWESFDKEKGAYVTGIRQKDGKVVADTEKNRVAILCALKEFRMDLMAQAMNAQLYKLDEEEEKN